MKYQNDKIANIINLIKFQEDFPTANDNPIMIEFPSGKKVQGNLHTILQEYLEQDGSNLKYILVNQGVVEEKVSILLFPLVEAG